MLFDLARRWWVVALRGVVAVVFGILAFVWPELTLLTLITLFGAFALVDGVLSLIAGLSSIQTNERWWAELIEGLVGIAFGLVVFFWPEVTALALLYLIAGWAVVTGILEIVAAIRLRRVITGEWAMILGGIASILFGVLLAAFPGAGILGLAWLIGLYAVLFGVLLIIVGLRLRGMREAA
ncbi:MAG: HdeD family acid-resistance protein [Chloroflexi bacterium]|nr:HdeD family acid-resistance protein [Chloroflexota bacterium]